MVNEIFDNMFNSFAADPAVYAQAATGSEQRLGFHAKQLNYSLLCLGTCA